MNERGNTLYGLDSFRPEWTPFVLPAAGNLILRKSLGEAEVRFGTVCLDARFWLDAQGHHGLSLTTKTVTITLCPPIPFPRLNTSGFPPLPNWRHFKIPRGPTRCTALLSQAKQ